jgi:hypothetical protein
MALWTTEFWYFMNASRCQYRQNLQSLVVGDSSVQLYTNPWRQFAKTSNFFKVAYKILGPQYATCFMSTFWHLEFWIISGHTISRFLRLSAPAIGYWHVIVHILSVVMKEWIRIICTEFMESQRVQLNSTREPPQQNHTVYTNRYHSILEIIANGLL